MTNLDKLLKEFKDARSASTQGRWYFSQDSICAEIKGRPIVFTGLDNSLAGADEQMILRALNKVSPDVHFSMLAANNSDKLIRIIEVMKCCLEKYEKSVLEIKGEIWHLGDAADEAIQQAEKIAGENE